MTTLVLIDLQRIFAHGPWGTPGFEQARAGAQRLAAAADDVLCTRFVAPALPVGSWQAYYEQWSFALQPPDSPDYALVDPFAGRPSVDATTFGKWPAIEAARRPAPGSEFVVAGVSTDCCVISTVLAMADAGMTVRVVADACAGMDETTHAQALAVMGLYRPQVEIVTLADVLGG